MFEDTIQFIYGGPSPMNRNVSSKHYVQNRNSLLKNGSGNNVTNEQKTSREQIKRGASFVVGQKLRESKWFTHEEINVLCAVLESGFIIERQNDSDNIFGIALWAPGFGKQNVFFCGRVKSEKKELFRKKQESRLHYDIFSVHKHRAC